MEEPSEEMHNVLVTYWNLSLCSPADAEVFYREHRDIIDSMYTWYLSPPLSHSKHQSLRQMWKKVIDNTVEFTT